MNELLADDDMGEDFPFTDEPLEPLEPPEPLQEVSSESEPDDAWESESEDEGQRSEAIPPVNSTVHVPLALESPRLHRNLYPGADVTLKQYLVTTLDWATKNQISMAALEQHLKKAARFFPVNNLVPTSIYQLLSLLDLNLSDFEKHVCVNDCVLFEDLDQSQFAQHFGDACTKCGELRFQRRGKAISPRKKFYHIPLAFQLGQMLEQLEVQRSLEKMAAEIRAGVTCLSSFWGGKLAAPLLESHDFLDHFQRKLALSIGLDGVQAFKKEAYEVWPVGVKIWNLHPEERTSKGKVLMTTVVPGPSCPKSFEPYLQPLLDEIKTSKSEGVSLFCLFSAFSLSFL